LIGVLAHLADQAMALVAAARVLGADGRLVIISPHPWNPGRPDPGADDDSGRTLTISDALCS